MTEVKKCYYCERASGEDGNKYQVYYRKKYGKYICEKHMTQILNHGKILNRTKYDKNEIIKLDDHAEIILYDNKQKEVARTIIDLNSVNKVNNIKWCLNSNGYARTTNNRRTILLHKYLMNCNDNDIIDHINRDRLDNRLSNLRLVTIHENNMNNSKQKNNTSGIIGVYLNIRRNNKWVANIKINRKNIYLGIFKDKEDAIVARLQAELKYFGADFAPQRELFPQYGIEVS